MHVSLATIPPFINFSNYSKTPIYLNSDPEIPIALLPLPASPLSLFASFSNDLNICIIFFMYQDFITPFPFTLNTCTTGWLWAALICFILVACCTC